MADPTCPLWRGKCREHKCLWYIQVQGTHPNNGAAVSEWGCAIAWLPWMMMENAKESRQTGAAVESFRNEMVKSNGLHSIIQQMAQRDSGPPQLTHDGK